MQRLVCGGEDETVIVIIGRPIEQKERVASLNLETTVMGFPGEQEKALRRPCPLKLTLVWRWANFRCTGTQFA